MSEPSPSIRYRRSSSARASGARSRISTRSVSGRVRATGASPTPAARGARGGGGWVGGTALLPRARAAPWARCASPAGAGRRDGGARSSLPPAQQLFPEGPYAAGPEREHDVAVAHLGHELLERGLEVSRVEHLSMAARGDGPRQRLGADLGDRLLAGRVHVGQEEEVGVVEGAAELVPERLRARVAVRLEEHDRAPAARARPQRLERRPDLGRVMAGVVPHEHAARFAPYLEAAIDAGEGGEAFLDGRKRHAEV